MTSLNAFREAEQLNLDDILAEFGIEFHNGLCPFRKECYQALGLRTQECAWNLDRPPTWQWCGGYKRRRQGQ